MISLSEIQQFNSEIDLFSLNIQPYFSEHVLGPWLKHIPKPPQTIIDLAAGYGIEAAQIEAAGHPCIALDLSIDVLSKKVDLGRRIVADIGMLPLAPNSVGGVLIKDAIVFLSPEQRQKAFDSLSKSLVSEGSILVASQLSDCLRVRYVPKESNLPQYETFRDASGWEEKLAEVSEEGTIFAVEFPSRPDDLLSIAQQCEFGIMGLESYDLFSGLAEDNRWLKRSGFVVEMRKS